MKTLPATLFLAVLLATACDSSDGPADTGGQPGDDVVADAAPDTATPDTAQADVADPGGSADDGPIDVATPPDPGASDPGPADVPTDVPAMPAFRVSDCGGFAAATGARVPAALDYCAQGVLDWHRDGDGALVLTDRRVSLNCCGEHSVSIAKDGGTWVLTETDAPEGVNGRCLCDCVFDFEATVAGFPDGDADVRIVRHVTDGGSGPVTAWEGSITVGADPGSVVTDPDPMDYPCTVP